MCTVVVISQHVLADNSNSTFPDSSEDGHLHTIRPNDIKPHVTIHISLVSAFRVRTLFAAAVGSVGSPKKLQLYPKLCACAVGQSLVVSVEVLRVQRSEGLPTAKAGKQTAMCWNVLLLELVRYLDCVGFLIQRGVSFWGKHWK